MSGIQHHSTIHASDSYIIFSSFSANMCENWHGLSIKSCKGSYKGEEEFSWITNAVNWGIT